MAKIDIKVTGLRQLERNLKQLPIKIAGNVLRQTVNAAATPMLKAAREKAPDDPRTKDDLKRGLTKGSRLDRNKFQASAGVRIKSKSPARFYWHLQEFGASHHAAQPFLRPAFDEKARESIRVFKKQMGQRIEKEARKLPKR